jgi:hypothetical protein
MQPANLLGSSSGAVRALTCFVNEKGDGCGNFAMDSQVGLGNTLLERDQLHIEARSEASLTK